MASIQDASLSSDSEDDLDYIPPAANNASSESSCGEHESDDELKLGSDRNKTKRKRLIITRQPELEISKALTAVDEKQRAKDIWASFLSDVKSVSPKNSNTFVCDSSDKVETKIENGTKSSQTKDPEIPKIFEFAIKTSPTNKDVNSMGCAVTKANDTETIQSQIQIGIPKKRGLDSVVGTIINKKQKLNVFEKTLIDWKSFKKNEGIEEELKTFNKGKQAFVERQRFLEKLDMRSFEMEKNIRQTLRKK